MDNGKIQQIGNLFPDTEGFENRTAGRVYNPNGLCPTIRTPSGGGITPMIMETDKTICLNSKVNGKQPSLQDRVYDVAGCSTAITTSFLPSIAEPAILRKYRSEEQRENRRKTKGQDKHFAGREIRPVADGVSNTLTSVQKDNLLFEPTKILQMGRGFNRGGVKELSPTITGKSFQDNNFVIGSMQKNSYRGSTEGISPTITAACGMGGGQTPMVGNLYRIRKLTPRECFRLTSVSEENIDKIQAAGISNSQQYKLAGNSIDVNVLKAIFRQLFKFNQTQQTY